jgi:hypothetical protein
VTQPFTRFKKGDMLIWHSNAGVEVFCKVIRVARDDTWIDMLCRTATGGDWRKRQVLHPDFLSECSIVSLSEN